MRKKNLPVLLVDDEEQILLGYSFILRASGLEDVVTIRDSREVESFLRNKGASAIVMDLIMPEISGNTLIRRIRHEFPNVPIIVMTAKNDIESAVECMKEGAFDYLVKPVERNRFVNAVKKALEIRELHSEVNYLKQHMLAESLEHEEAFRHVVTKSRKMISIFHYLEAVSKTQRPVLICGETGVGKELLAKSIYKLSRVNGEFVPVNVAGLDDTMFSDTLFGHIRGAFTGAESDREGLIVKATDGVLLLDEIGDLSEASQIKLLRLVEEQTYYPLGSDTSLKTNALVIATTNKDLDKMLEKGTFRRDLYYRLSSHSVHIPPLRERPEDIPVLFDYFIKKASVAVKRKKPKYANELMTLLCNYSYPGNVRELQTMVFDAVAQHKSGTLSTRHFKQYIERNRKGIKISGKPDSETKDKQPIKISECFPTLKEIEEYMVSEALNRSNGNQGVAASLLGISRQALNKRLKRAENSTRSIS